MRGVDKNCSWRSPVRIIFWLWRTVAAAGVCITVCTAFDCGIYFFSAARLLIAVVFILVCVLLLLCTCDDVMNR